MRSFLFRISVTYSQVVILFFSCKWRNWRKISSDHEVSLSRLNKRRGTERERKICRLNKRRGTERERKREREISLAEIKKSLLKVKDSGQGGISEGHHFQSAHLY